MRVNAMVSKLLGSSRAAVGNVAFDLGPRSSARVVDVFSFREVYSSNGSTSFHDDEAVDVKT